MKKGRTVRYTLEEIRERRKKGLSKTDWDRINAMTDEEIERNAREDNRRHGIPDDWYKNAKWVDGLNMDDHVAEPQKRAFAKSKNSADG